MRIRSLRPAPVVLILLYVCFLIVTPRPAAAGPIVFTGVVVNDGSCVPYVGCHALGPDENDPGNIAFQGTALSQIAGTFGGANLSAAADAGAGFLRTSASASYNLASSGYRIAAGVAAVVDRLTITAPSVTTGTAGVLLLSLTLEGQIGRSGSAGAGTGVAVLAGGTDPFEDQEIVGGFSRTSPGFATDVVTLNVPFTYGESFLLTMFMYSVAGTAGVCTSIEACPETEGVIAFQASGLGTGNANFFNTLVISGLVPTVGGAAVANPTFIAESGAQYTVNGVVPEPGTLVLLGSGTAILLARRRRKRAL